MFSGFFIFIFLKKCYYTIKYNIWKGMYMLLNELLGIKYPVIQGAMANISDGKFAASVSNAGGLGIIAAGGWDVNKLKEEIRICKSLTNNVFGVNIMLMSPYVESIVDLVCDEKIAVGTTGAGNPGPYIAKLKAAGCKVFPVVASAILAKRMERYQIDGIIAEGTESGGHVGEATTMTLIPQVVEAVKVPVIAAGGIATGKQFNASLSLGAIGVQVGTIMLATEECPIHDNYKNAVVKAKDNDTIVTGRSLGAPVRILKNEMAKHYIELERLATDRMELEKITIGGLKKAVIDGDIQMGSVMLGQTAGIIKEIKPVAKVLEDLMKEAFDEQKQLNAKLDKLKLVI